MNIKQTLIFLGLLLASISVMAQPTRLKPGQIKEAPDSNYIWLSQEGGAWDYVPVTELDNIIGSDTRLANPRIVNNYLIHDIIDVVTNSDLGDEAVDLEPFLDNTDNQVLSLVDNNLTIEDGNTIDLLPGVIYCINNSGLFTLVDINNGTNDITFTYPDGSTVVFEEVVTSISYNPVTQDITYTDEDGVVTTLDLSNLISSIVNNPDGTYTHTSGDGTTQVIGYDLVQVNDTTFQLTDHDGTVVNTIVIDPPTQTLPPVNSDLYISNDTIYHVGSDGTIQSVILPPDFGDLFLSNDTLFHVDSDLDTQYVVLPLAEKLPCTEICLADGTLLLPDCGNCESVKDVEYFARLSGDNDEKESGTLLDVEAAANSWVQGLYDGTFCVDCVITQDSFLFDAGTIVSITKTEESGSTVRLVYEFVDFNSRIAFQNFLGAAMMPGSRIEEIGGAGSLYFFAELITDIDLGGPTILGYTLDFSNLSPPDLVEECTDPITTIEYITSVGQLSSRIGMMDLNEPVTGGEFYQAFGGPLFIPGDVWTIAGNGSTSFVKPGGADFTTVMDVISPTVALTRAETGPIYNFFGPENPTNDPNFGNIFWDYVCGDCIDYTGFDWCTDWLQEIACSPSSTMWNFLNPITDYNTVPYGRLIEWQIQAFGLDWSPMIDQPAILYLENEDVYVEFIFNSWLSGPFGDDGMGGVSWTRALPPLAPGEFTYVVTNYSNTAGPCEGCYTIEVSSTDCYGADPYDIHHDTTSFCITGDICADVFPSNLYSPFDGALLGVINSNSEIYDLLVNDPAKPEGVTIEIIDECHFSINGVDPDTPPNVLPPEVDPQTYMPQVCGNFKGEIYAGGDRVAATDGSIEYHFAWSNTGLPGSWNVSGWATYTGVENSHDFGPGSYQNGDYIRHCFRLSGQPGTSICDTKRIPSPSVTAQEPFDPENEPLVLHICNDAPHWTNSGFEYGNTHVLGEMNGETFVYDCIETFVLFTDGVPVDSYTEGITYVPDTEDCYYMIFEPGLILCHQELGLDLSSFYSENYYNDGCVIPEVTTPSYQYTPECLTDTAEPCFELSQVDAGMDIHANLGFRFETLQFNPVCWGGEPTDMVIDGVANTLPIPLGMIGVDEPPFEASVSNILTNAGYGFTSVNVITSSTGNGPDPGEDCTYILVEFEIIGLTGASTITFTNEYDPTVIDITTNELSQVVENGNCPDWDAAQYYIEYTDGAPPLGNVLDTTSPYGYDELADLNAEHSELVDNNYKHCWYFHRQVASPLNDGLFNIIILNGVEYPMSNEYSGSYNVVTELINGNWDDLQLLFNSLGINATVEGFAELGTGFSVTYGILLNCVDMAAIESLELGYVGPFSGGRMTFVKGAEVPGYPSGVIPVDIGPVKTTVEYCNCTPPDGCVFSTVYATDCDGENFQEFCTIGECFTPSGDCVNIVGSNENDPVMGDSIVINFKRTVPNSPGGCFSVPPDWGIWIDGLEYYLGSNNSSELMSDMTNALNSAGVSYGNLILLDSLYVPYTGGFEGVCDEEHFYITVVCPSTSEIYQACNQVDINGDCVDPIYDEIHQIVCGYTFSVFYPSYADLRPYGGELVVVNSDADIEQAFADIGILAFVVDGQVCFFDYFTNVDLELTGCSNDVDLSNCGCTNGDDITIYPQFYTPGGECGAGDCGSYTINGNKLNSYNTGSFYDSGEINLWVSQLESDLAGIGVSFVSISVIDSLPITIGLCSGIEFEILIQCAETITQFDACAPRGNPRDPVFSVGTGGGLSYPADIDLSQFGGGANTIISDEDEFISAMAGLGYNISVDGCSICILENGNYIPITVN